MPPVTTIEEIRRANLKALLAGFRPERKFADLIERSQTQVTQWKNASPDSKTGKPRQLSSEICRLIEEKCGKPEGWMDQQHAPAGVDAPPVQVAQVVSLPSGDDELQTYPWEFVVSAVLPLPRRFCAAVPDDALAPRSPKGTEFVFASDFKGRPGDGVAVIVQTAGGRRYMRMHFALDGNAWEARARDPAFPALHSERDGLQLLAVAVFRPGGQA